MQARRGVANAMTPPKTPDTTSNDGAVFDHNLPRRHGIACNPNLYRMDRRNTSSPKLGLAFASEGLPLPRIPQQFVVKQAHDASRQQLAAATNQKQERILAEQADQGLRKPFHATGHVQTSTVALHRVSERNIPSEAGPNEPKDVSSGAFFSSGVHSSNSSQLQRSRLPRSTSRVVRVQQSASELRTSPNAYQYNTTSTSGSPLSVMTASSRSGYDARQDFLENDPGRENWERGQAEIKDESKFSPRRAQRKLKQLYHSNFSSAGLGNDIPESLADDTEDITLVSKTQDLRYWAGRCSAINDRFRNEGQASIYHWGRQDAVRHDKVVEELQSKCTTMEAEESLAAFVRAWRGGWSGGMKEACRAAVEMVPKQPPTPEKKLARMGKMFGKKKSQ